MKLSEIRNAYEELSGSLSKINRQLTFAGIGIVWLFRVTTEQGTTTIDKGMLVPILCFVISFGVDLLQYLWQSYIWYFFYWCKRKHGSKEEDEVNEPEWPNVVAWVMFTIKVLALMIAYICLGIFLYDYLFCQ